MKLLPIRALILLAIGSLLAQTGLAQGRNIRIKLTPLKNTKVYLGSNYGSTNALFDSAFLNDKSEGVFTAPTKLTGGVYFIVTATPAYEIQFDFLMDNEQQFSITADTAAKDKVVITGSAENEYSIAYKNFLASKTKYMQGLEADFKTMGSRTKKDTTELIDKSGRINKELEHYRDSILEKYPGSLISTLFHLIKKPVVPAIPVVKGKPDSLYPYHFVKEHYWDDVNFSDDRILHTPFLEPRMDEYFKYYISIEPDSIIKEVNYMLLAARGGKEIYPYLLTKFTKEYMNPKFMGQDKVFVFLFENYYARGDTSLLDAPNRKIVTERAYNLMANQIGLPASPMNFADTAGRIVPLYSVKSDFTIVAFWDPTCGHCKIDIPRLDSMYQAKWKGLGVAIYAVNVTQNENELPLWKKYITDNRLSGWVNTRETQAIRDATEKARQMNFRQAYDMQFTPTLYLLDKDKRIIAKKLTIEQFDELIKLKKGVSSKG